MSSTTDTTAALSDDGVLLLPMIDLEPFMVASDSSSSFNNEKQEKEKRKLQCAKEWDDAFTTVGFCRITGHGVSSELIQNLRREANKFFQEKSSDEKMKYNRGPYGEPNGGYHCVGQETVSQSRDQMGSDGGGKEEADAVAVALPDLVESFILKPSQVDNDPPELARLGILYQSEMIRVLECLHKISAMALGLPSDFFSNFYKETPNYSLRLAYYPPEGNDDASKPPRLRYGAHTDYQGFTILLQDDNDTANEDSGGLEIKLPSTGIFHPMKAIPNTFVVNIGDLFQVWTNDRWKSTVHRVSSGCSCTSSSRLSIPFFTGPRDDALIKPILRVGGDEEAKYETLNAGEHLWRKLKATQT